MALKRKKLLIHASSWMNLIGSMLSKNKLGQILYDSTHMIKYIKTEGSMVIVRGLERRGIGSCLICTESGTSLVVHWLRLQGSNAGGISLIPGRSHMPQSMTKFFLFNFKKYIQSFSLQDEKGSGDGG